MKNKIATNKLGMQPTNERQHMTRYWPNSLGSPVESPICHNGFPPRLGRLKTIQWSRHRSFLYGCDRSPETHVLKLGTEIPN